MGPLPLNQDSQLTPHQRCQALWPWRDLREHKTIQISSRYRSAAISLETTTSSSADALLYDPAGGCALGSVGMWPPAYLALP